jgi:hypothetical protein
MTAFMPKNFPALVRFESKPCLLVSVIIDFKNRTVLPSCQ